MLSHLFIRNFVLVTEMEMDFHSGLTVMTGETGAGKSIIFDALGLAMGGRAENNLIRHDCDQAEIVATFHNLTTDILDWMRLNELETPEPEELILRRIIRRDGRSRAFINGTPTTTQSLRNLSSMLIDIQGQHAHQRLLQRGEQLHLLDQYANVESLLTAMSGQFALWEQLTGREETLRENMAERRDRLALLDFQLQEFDNLGLNLDELSQLEKEQSRLANGEQLLEHGRQIHNLINGEDEEQSAVQQLYRAVARMESLEELDPEIEPLRRSLLDAVLQSEEIASELHLQMESYALDPERLRWLNERLSDISDLARKHRCSPEELLKKQSELQQQQEQLRTADQQSENIREEIVLAENKCSEISENLHQMRIKAAKRLQQEVSKEIHSLGMEHGNLKIVITSLSDGVFRSHGSDDIEFQVSTNGEEQLHPLAKVASGGELSRISLAIQIASANRGETPTLIFDEVDSGVGGGTAEQVGKKLRSLGNHTQILCVTHLPQVAAQGHYHLKIDKQLDKENRTVSTTKLLSNKERTEEIARMVGGVKITPQSRAHAEEMLG